MAEVTLTLRTKAAFGKEFSIGRVILSGHSGGYQVISAILAQGGMTESIKEVWLFDALYAQRERFDPWCKSTTGRFINIYTENGGTKKQTEQMIADFKGAGLSVYASKEETTDASELRTNRLVFLYTELGHNEVIDKHELFRAFLETSCLAARATDKRGQ